MPICVIKQKALYYARGMADWKLVMQLTVTTER